MSWSGNGLPLLRDERIAPLAVSALPAWLWNMGASRILWANPTGAAIFGAVASSKVGMRQFDAGQPASAQIAQLAATLSLDGPQQVVQLRGFGAGIGRPLACRCSHITLPDHSEAILVVATGRAGPDLSLDERVSRLLAGNDQPVAAFTADGKLIDATPAAASFLRGKQSLAALEIAAMAAEAARTGHAEGSAAHCSVRIDRIGGGPATVLLAAFSELSETEKLVAAAAETSGTSSTAVDEPAASDPAVSDVLPADAVEAAAAEIAAAANAIDAAVPTVPEPVEAAPQEIAPREPIAMAAPEPGVVTPAAEPVAGAADEPEATAAPTPAIAATLDPMLPSAAEPPLQSAERRHPLRFVWQIDAEGRFTLEFRRICRARRACDGSCSRAAVAGDRE